METKAVVPSETNLRDIQKEKTAAGTKVTGQKKTIKFYGIICSCWAAKLKYMEAAAEIKGEEDNTSTELFKNFVLARIDCEACIPETPRKHEACSCSVSYEYLKSLFPPFAHPTFPTTFQKASAEVDWK